MGKYIVSILFVLAVFATVARFGNGQVPVPVEPDSVREQLKAVHYFSSSWPKSFWEDFENSQVDGDFAQIKADGFNTIILVIPWLGFETGFEDGAPEPSGLYDRLGWLLTKIDQAGLGYGLRVGFPHSFDPHNGIGNAQMCREIFTSSTLRENWLRYLSHIAEQVDQHRDSFKFAFFSWEDFFCPYVAIPAMPEDQRLELARNSGYQEWLGENFPIQVLEVLYQKSHNSIDTIPVPDRESPAFLLFLNFVDQFMIDQLKIPGRQFLPELAMEVRVDKDRIVSGDKTHWMGHDLALSDDRMRGTYWGAYYGARNEGELLTAKQALQNFDYMLDDVSNNGENTNHIVEQFNFADNTPGYAGHHAQIEAAELPAFLEGAAQLLKQKSRGYGLWAYRDYADSAIYNASFELDLRGWDYSGTVESVINKDGDKALRLQAGAEISQTFAPYERFAGLTPSQEVTFCANFESLAEPAQITLTLNDSIIGQLDVTQTGQACVATDAQAFKQLQVKFSISTDSQLQLDDLRLYSYVQILGVYDENGKPGPLRDLIFRLNTEWLNE